MNSKLARMNLFEIVDKHLENGCEMCADLLGSILYHAQSDENLRPLLDDFMKNGGLEKTKQTTESKEDFDLNIRKMKERYGKKD